MTTETKSGVKTPAPGGIEIRRSIFDKFPGVWVALILVVTLAILFRKSFDPHYAHFSNDGPLGINMSEANQLPGPFSGMWMDLNWIGSEGLAAVPSFSYLMRWFLGPFWGGNFIPPITLLFTGLCAFYCLKKFKLSPMACLLGGLAAGLNSDFFSTSCWGVSSQTVGFGSMFLAVGWVFDAGKSAKSWIIILITGAAVGLGVMEAYDIGAIFSLFVAAFVMYCSFFMDKGDTGSKIGTGILRVALVAVFAGLVSAYALQGLIGTQVIGVAAAQQDSNTKQKAWPGATEWSLPKIETLQVVIPGIFGYRNQWHMYDNDQPKEDQYWGRIGEQPILDEARKELSNPNPEVREQAENILRNPNVLRRLIGTGFYGGITVFVVALWGVFQGFRKQGPFTRNQVLCIRFFFGVAILSLLMSYGKYAPFYQVFYALPYASAIRNPDKFMHVFHWALIILFGFGAHSLVVGYLKNSTLREKLSSFDKKWLIGCFIAIGISLVGWMVYANKSSELLSYLQTTGIPADDMVSVSKFSIESVGWYVLFLILVVALMALILKGKFAGSRAGIGVFLLGLIVVVDLVRADQPWNIYWDKDYKYHADPIIDILAEKPYEHRVAFLPPFKDWTAYQNNQQYSLLNNAYGSNWKQHLFPYHDIQCADDIQEARPGEDKQRFMAGMPLFRFWELSNTRYLLGPGGDFARKVLDPTGTQFRVITSFDFVPKPGVVTPRTMVDFSAIPNTNGSLAVIEYLGALPRAKLFSNWQVNDDDDAVLHTLASPAFDVKQTVIVSSTNFAAPLPTNTNQAPGTVDIIAPYKSKRIELSADVKVPSILFLSERYNPKWRAEVDGKPAPLLRCDFIARGIYLEPGKHKVVLRFVSPLGMLYLSLAAIALGLIFVCWLAVSDDTDSAETATPSPTKTK